MSNDIELTQELIAYLSVLGLPLPDLVKKIPLALQKAKLSEITLELNNNNLCISSMTQKDTGDYILDKTIWSKYGLRADSVKKDFDKIKRNDSGKIFSATMEEIIKTFNEKILEFNLPPAILAYTKLYEKFKTKNPEADSNRIYNLIDEKIESLLLNKEAERLTYNYFKRAYQGYAKPQGFTYLAGLETENLKTIFNTTKELHINFTRYQTQYVTLMNLIEELNICTEDETAPKILIENLKRLTDTCFLSLIQTSSGKQFAKTTIENFKSATRNLIKNYIKKHSDECKKQSSILDKILEFIANMIPSFIFSEDKKMTLFSNSYTASGIRIKNLNGQIKTTIQHHFTY
jgi:hypothetical protein